MYGYFGTTVIQSLLLFAGIITAGELTGFWMESALGFISLALGISVWRRNQLYRWLEKRPGQPMTQVPGLWLDMTRRIQKREAELSAERDATHRLLANLHQSLASLDAGLVHLTNEWRINWWNKPATQLLGLREAFDKDASVFNLVRTPELFDYVEAQQFELPITLPSPITSGTMLEYTVCSIEHTGYLLVVRDVTRFTRLERMRSDFIANVSHELKTPLTVITGYLETILDNQLVSAGGVRAVEQAFKQADRMNSLIKDLLMLSQLETTEPDSDPQKIRIQDLVENAIQDAQEVKKAVNKVDTQISTGVIPTIRVLGDWNELSSALTNLTGNAVRYSHDGAHIEIEFKMRGNDGVLTIRDNGPGIPPEHLPRITERFYRVDNSHSRETGGTGLGLAIVKHILYRHGGTLEVSSKVAQGSEFRMVFPADRIEN
jgi:two-component system phosphate regulon sensor histidine kinase PhoR